MVFGVEGDVLTRVRFNTELSEIMHTRK